MATVLVIPAGPYQIPAMEAARDLGFRVTAMDGDANAPGMRFADEAIARDPGSTKNVLDVAKGIADLAAIVTVASDPCSVPAAEAAAALGFSGPDPQAVRRARDKALCRAAIQESGLAFNPSFYAVTSLAEAKDAGHDIGYPLVLKPTALNGSKGVVVVETPDEISDGFDYVRSFIDGDGEILIEEYLQGPEVSIEGFVQNSEVKIVAVVDKRVSPPPHCVEVGHVCPSRLPETTQHDLREATVQVIGKLGLDMCPFHAEWKATPHGPKLVEIGARLGGGCITSHLVPLATGVDLMGASVQLALGQPCVLDATRAGASAIAFLQAEPGTVSSVDGLDAARCAEGVQEVVCDLSSGDAVDSLENSNQRHGHVIAAASNPEQAEDLALAAASLVRVETA